MTPTPTGNMKLVFGAGALAAPSVDVPAGMRVVTQDEFFAFLRADPRDIMPKHEHGDYTLWETPQRVVVGRSLPGWKYPGRNVYMLKSEASR